MKTYIFVSAQDGIIEQEDGRKTEWANVKLADPETFENHTINYDKNYIREGAFPQRGEKIQPVIELRTPFKKTSVVMIAYKRADQK